MALPGRKVLVWFWALVVPLLLVACGRSEAAAVPKVRLNKLDPIPTPRVTVQPLRVAVAAIISPKGTLESYRPLVAYLGERVGRPAELVQRRTYAETNELVRRGEVDVAFVCTRAYVIGHREFGMELLAIPEVQGQRVYYSVVIVRADSPFMQVEDLRGATFAFTDPLSNTGHLYPVYLVYRMGYRPEQFFKQTFFTYSHDNAIRAVVEGVADAAAVDSLVLDYLLRREPGLREAIRVIHRSPPFGMPPVVVGPGIRPQVKVRLANLLFSMHEDPEGRAVLAELGIDRFVPADDRAYNAIREMEAFVQEMAGRTP